MAALMGSNKYLGQKQFMREKAATMLGGSRPSPNLEGQLLMDWGTYFEPVHRAVMETLFCTQIQETSMAQGMGWMRGCHQSPDGVCVVDTQLFL